MTTKDPSIAFSLLSRAHSPDSATRIYTEKVLHRPLHLKPTTSLPPTTAQLARRALRTQKASSAKKTKLKPLSARKKRALGLYELPSSARKHSIYVPLHRMWVGYIQELLWDNKGFRPLGTDAAAKLCSADFHGAELEVVRSRCVGRVGVKGIVVKDSKHVFEVVTEKDQVKVVPKEHTLFRFCVPPPQPLREKMTEIENTTMAGVEEEKENTAQEAPAIEIKDLVFELHGDQFIYRAADRANRKFKPHFLPDL